MKIYAFKNKAELDKMLDEIHSTFFNLNSPHKNQFRLKFIYERLNYHYFNK